MSATAFVYAVHMRPTGSAVQSRLYPSARPRCRWPQSLPPARQYTLFIAPGASWRGPDLLSPPKSSSHSGTAIVCCSRSSSTRAALSRSCGDSFHPLRIASSRSGWNLYDASHRSFWASETGGSLVPRPQVNSQRSGVWIAVLVSV